MKKLLIAIVFISSFLISQSLTKGWINDDFEVPGNLFTDELEVLGGTPGVGKVLTDDGTGAGIAVWAAPTGGLTDPMTTRGDIIYRDPTNITARLGLGANLFVLQSDGTDLAWSEFLASEMNIVDAGSKIAATEVEGALQENRIALDLNTSLLNVTPGTATASKALVVDANKDIDLGTGDLDANIGVFGGTLTTNGNYVMEGYAIGENVGRSQAIRVFPGATPNTNIDVDGLFAGSDVGWNQATVTDATNLAASGTSGSFTLSADGESLTLDLTEVVVGLKGCPVSIQQVNSSSTVHYNVRAEIISGNIIFKVFIDGSVGGINWLSIMDTGDWGVLFNCNFVTSS